MLRRIIDRATRGSIIRRLRHEKIYARIEGLEGQLRILESRLGSLEPNLNSLLAPAKRDEERRYSRGLGERVVAAFAFISPEDPLDTPLVRIGKKYDGGYVMADSLLTGGIAYSLGIGDNISWDMEMAERGYQVYQYDHTIDSLPVEHPSFHFSRRGICASGQDGDLLSPLDHLVAENGHLSWQDMVLKVDIEGTEWDVFSTLPSHIFECFSQIVVEFHWFDRLDHNGVYEKVIRSLRGLHEEFVPIHVHANNFGDIVVMGGVAVPPVLEVTYVRRGLIGTGACTRTFPTTIDQPNDPNRPDLYLGSFQFPRE